MHGTDTTPAPGRSGRARLIAAGGVLLAAGTLVSAATLTDSADVTVTMDGSRNTLDILVAGSTAPDWRPVPSDWQQGDLRAVTMTLSDDRVSGALMSPGSALELRVAALNASPRVAARLSLTIADPDPRDGHVDPETGWFVELFDQLVFTVREDGRTLLDRTAAPDLGTYTWDAALPSGGAAVLDVTIEMPAGLGNEWQLASTDVQFHLAAVNA